jgi:GTP pyrophosphokinase
VAMIDDVRIALVKLAERTVVMRLLKTASRPKQLQIAQEIHDVYAPLALRLGVGQLKWELEDLAFRYLQPDAYHRIAKMLDGRRLDRDHYIGRVQRLLEDELKAAGLQFQLTGRSKHISSIYRKMQRKGVGFSQIYDIRAVRILVSSVAKCYQVLGVIHGLWRSIPNEFDDYIANPKDNGYRSLHTAVIGPEGRILEIQIRTHAMHDDAELGVCAHWRYKDGERDTDRGESSYQDKLEWLRQVLDWHEGVGGEQAQLHFEAYDERIYVFTPQGDVVSLAQGATALDFAYHVHTEIGHRCRRAKVDGVLTPLTTPLQTGQRVEIITREASQPRREWLSSAAGYLTTARARARVHEWFSAQTREDNIAAGRQLMERECARLALTALDYSAIAKTLGRASVDDLYFALGSAEMSTSEIFRVVQYLGRGSDQFRAILPPSVLALPRGGIRFDSSGQLLVNYARCCMPVAPEAITGFVTRSRGVSVHRASCHRIAIAEESAPDQLIELMWTEVSTEPRQTDIALEADDRQGLLVDITSVLSSEGVNIISVQTQTNTETRCASMRLRIEIGSLDVLAGVLSRLAEIDGMRSVRRIRIEAPEGGADHD